MHVSTGGIHVRARRAWIREGVELVSSMRLAISLLAILAIASVIGTILKQNEPFGNYVNQFGGFWFEIFRALGLYNVYNTAWFLAILGVLVTSTSLCVTRNAPRMLADMRAWRDHLQERSFASFGHRHSFTSASPRASLAADAMAWLAKAGYRARLKERGDDAVGATLIAAKAGTWNRLGYIFTHSAIVVICMGGLLDSELPIRMQIAFLGKVPVRGDTLLDKVPESGRLSTSNPTFRATAFVPEGGATRTASVNVGDRALVQQLPFTLRLKKFSVEYYSTGMPRLFASAVEVIESDTGKRYDADIKVNEPLFVDGIAIYQSSFDDGGSKLKLVAYPLHGARAEAFALDGVVGAAKQLAPDALRDVRDPAQRYTVEFTGFRAINVEDLAAARAADAGSDANKRLQANVAAVVSSGLGSGAARGGRKDLHNVGPSVQYKLRDSSGQAREFSNYMLPVELDGFRVFLAGVRDQPDEGFRYLRIPADTNGTVREFMRLRAALADPALRNEAARRFADKTLPRADAAQGNDRLREQLALSAARGLETFAGAPGAIGKGAGKSGDKGSAAGGYAAIASFIERSVAKEDQENAIGVVMKILAGSVRELWQLAREKGGLAPAAANEHEQRFVQLAMNALSDSFFYDAPVYLQLDSFEQVQASVFQLTRSPGKRIVYLGCVLLVAGIFAMFYIRERRLWLWLKDDGRGGTEAKMAMSATRRALDFDHEFSRMRDELDVLKERPGA